MLTINSPKIHEILSLLTITLFAIFGMLALFHPGLFTAHDIYHQVVRIHYYYQAILDGQFPPYWIMPLANGYGYPLFIFSYTLPWIFSLPFLLSGFSLYTSLKISFFLGFLLSGYSMYYLCKTVFKNRLSAVVSAILYLWAPYHFMIVFVGASIGVLYSFIFLPLIILGLYLCFLKQKSGVLVLSIALPGLILSHLLHTIFFFPTILIFVICLLLSHRFKFGEFIQIFKRLSFSLILSFAICSFYIVPVLFYSGLTYVKTESGFATLYERNFIHINQLIYSKWGYGPIINNAKNGEISFQLGIAQWACLGLLFGLFLLKKRGMKFKTLTVFVILGFLINALLLLDYSAPFWKFMQKIIIIDYPFRFILPLVFLSALSSAIIIGNLSKKISWVFIFLIILIALYTNRNHIRVNLYTDTPLKDYLSSITEITTNTFHEYAPVTGNRKLINISNAPLIDKNIPISNVRQTTNSLSFNIVATESAVINIKQFSFPGISTYINEKKIPHSINPDGLISINITQGSHNIKVVYTKTPVVIWSAVASIIGLAVWLIWLLSFWRKKTYTNNAK